MQCNGHILSKNRISFWELYTTANAYGPPIVKKFRYSLCLETIPNRNHFEISESFRTFRNHFGNVRNHFEIFRNYFERNLVSKSSQKSLGPNVLLLFGCILATPSMYCLFQFFVREVSNHGCFSVIPVYCFHVFIKRFFQRRRAARVCLVSHHVATGSWARDGQLAAKPGPVRIFCKPHSCSNEARLQRLAVPTTRRNLLWGADSTPENAQRQPESGVRTDVSVASDEGLLVPTRSSIYWWAGQATFPHYTRATGMPKNRVQQLDTNCFGSWSEPANRRRELGFSLTFERYTVVNDASLDAAIADEMSHFPRSGETNIIAGLRRRGLFVPRWRVREAVIRVDPINRANRWGQRIVRRPYCVPHSNFL